MLKAWYSIKEAADYLRCTKEYVNHLIDSGYLIPALRLEVVRAYQPPDDSFPNWSPEQKTIPEGKYFDENYCYLTGVFEIESFSSFYTCDYDSDLKGFCVKYVNPIIKGHIGSVEIKPRYNDKPYRAMEEYHIEPSEFLISSSQITLFEMGHAAIASSSISDDFIKNDLPTDYLDPKHEFYSEELAAAVKVWLLLYGENGKYRPQNSHKSQIEKGIKQLNYSKFTKNAIERIVTVANPNKKGGVPRMPEEEI